MYRCLILLAGLSSMWTLAGQGGDKTEAEKKAKLLELIKSTPEQFIKRFDKNKDGYLTRDEVPPFLVKNFDKADLTGDGKLDKKEVAQALKVLRERLGIAKTPPANPEVDRVVNQLLQQFDTNKDGKISKSEAKGTLAENFEKLDLNKDGFLDKNELRQMATRILAQGGGPGTAAPQDDFDALDLNADGRLTRQELKGTRFAPLFDQIDTNRDGKIDRREFEAFLKKEAGKKTP
jgi:Ca2+-binding EF-hand superfamily protein